MYKIRKIAVVVLACIGSGFLIPSCKSGSESGSVAGDGSVDLKLNFKAGDKFLYTNKVNQKITSFGVTMDQSMLIEMVYNYTGEEGNNKKLTITYDHIVVDMNVPMGGRIQYDSKTPGTREGGMAMFDSLIGKSYSISVAPGGGITMGNEGLINGSKSGKSNMANPLSDSVVKQMMQNAFDIYPGKTVKVGDNWIKKTEMSMPMGGKINVSSTYTLKAVEGNKATITMVSELSLPQETGNKTPGEMQMNGKQEGSMEVDIQTGQILSGKTTQDIKASMKMEGMEQAIPVEIKGEIIQSSKKL